MHEFILSNARLVLENEVLNGSIRVVDGVIKEVNPGKGFIRGSFDCNENYLSPGLIELHTDNLERHMQPRANVKWPIRAAILSHDRELESAGITTVFDALRVGSIVSDKRGNYLKYARQVTDTIKELRAEKSLKISHFTHLRAEVCSETLEIELKEFTPEDRVGIVSLMDHTPGQKQFRDLDKMAEYFKGKYSMSPKDVEDHFERLYKIKKAWGDRNNAATLSANKRLGAILASHDDTTENDAITSIENGCKIAEFPTTVEASKVLNRSSINIIMGGPNILRGESHSGNVAAKELVSMGCCNILSSDYMPSSLLMGAVKLGDILGDFAKGIKAVTETPAKAANLNDRGLIKVGMRADLLLFDVKNNFPIIQRVWTPNSPQSPHIFHERQ